MRGELLALKHRSASIKNGRTMSSLFKIPSPLSIMAKKQNPEVEGEVGSPSSSTSSHPRSSRSPADDAISPSVDSAIDVTSPIHIRNSPVESSGLQNRGRLSPNSLSISTNLRSSPSQADRDYGAGLRSRSASRSVSFIPDFRDSSFDGEPDIPELVEEGRLFYYVRLIP